MKKTITAIILSVLIAATFSTCVFADDETTTAAGTTVAATAGSEEAETTEPASVTDVTAENQTNEIELETSRIDVNSDETVPDIVEIVVATDTDVAVSTTPNEYNMTTQAELPQTGSVTSVSVVASAVLALCSVIGCCTIKKKGAEDSNNA